MTNQDTGTPSARADAAEIEVALKELADTNRAVQERRYLKSPCTHLGVRVPEVRMVVRNWLREVKSADRVPLTHDRLWALTDELWASPVYEMRRCAVELLTIQSVALQPADLPRVRGMIAGTFTWALVDPLSTDVASSIIESMEPGSVDDVLDQWARDDSFWVRRAALLSQLRMLRSGNGDPRRFFRYADAMLDESEFFIQKAIGWVLRDMSKRRPDVVYQWLHPRAERCSTVTLREAVKYLSASEQAAIRLAQTT